MQKKILVVAPHADDETLGAGGTLLKAKELGIDIYWLLITSPDKRKYSKTYIKEYQNQILKVKKFYGFSEIKKLNYPSASLDFIDKSKIIVNIQNSIKKFMPDTLIIPHIGDAHRDHFVTHTCAMAACKIFKIKKLGLQSIYSMEILSETDIFTSKKDYQYQNKCK